MLVDRVENEAASVPPTERTDPESGADQSPGTPWRGEGGAQGDRRFLVAREVCVLLGDDVRERRELSLILRQTFDSAAWVEKAEFEALYEDMIVRAAPSDPEDDDALFAPVTTVEALDAAGTIARGRGLASVEARLVAESRARSPELLSADLHLRAVRCAAGLLLAAETETPARARALRGEAGELQREALEARRAVVAAAAAPGDAAAYAAARSIRTELLMWIKHGEFPALRDEPALAVMNREERARCELLWKDMARLIAETP